MLNHKFKEVLPVICRKKERSIKSEDADNMLMTKTKFILK